jgi:hypothetical protein
MELEEFFEQQRERERQANIQTAAVQRAISWGGYFIRPIVEYGLLVFGDIPTEEEFLDVEAGSDPIERAAVKRHWQDIHERGYRFACCYSVVAPQGEYGSTHIVTMIPITQDEFEVARAAHWDPGREFVLGVQERVFTSTAN